MLTLFFELPGILDSTLDYVNTVQKNSIIFRNYKDKIVLPLICAFDDYENNNPLGSHKGVSKCGATYLSCPALHPDLQSKLENIFFSTLTSKMAAFVACWALRKWYYAANCAVILRN